MLLNRPPVGVAVAVEFDEVDAADSDGDRRNVAEVGNASDEVLGGDLGVTIGEADVGFEAGGLVGHGVRAADGGDGLAQPLAHVRERLPGGGAEEGAARVAVDRANGEGERSQVGAAGAGLVANCSDLPGGDFVSEGDTLEGHMQPVGGNGVEVVQVGQGVLEAGSVGGQVGLVEQDVPGQVVPIGVPAGAPPPVVGEPVEAAEGFPVLGVGLLFDGVRHAPRL